MALEQAEQQFRAASITGSDSRALNLFYGLSQAGRAIAAASHTLDDSSWSLQGHGIRTVLGTPDREWDLITVRPIPKEERGSFVVLSKLLGSPSQGEASLRQLWQLLPELHYISPPGPEVVHPPLVNLYLHHSLTMGVNGRTFLDVTPPDVVTRLSARRRPTPRDWLDTFPDLRPWRLSDELVAGSEPGTWPPAGQPLQLHRDLAEGERGSLEELQGGLAQYRGSPMLFPAIAGESAARHPLMLWWAVLHALSMLTRYSPAQWSAAIDVDASPSATDVEFILEAALAAVPDLIDETLGQVSASG